MRKLMFILLIALLVISFQQYKSSRAELPVLENINELRGMVDSTDVIDGSISGADLADTLRHTGRIYTTVLDADYLYIETAIGVGTDSLANVLHLDELGLGEGLKLQRVGGGLKLDQAWGLLLGITDVDDRYFFIYDYSRTGFATAGIRLVITDEDGFIGIGGIVDPNAILDIGKGYIKQRIDGDAHTHIGFIGSGRDLITGTPDADSLNYAIRAANDLIFITNDGTEVGSFTAGGVFYVGANTSTEWVAAHTRVTEDSTNWTLGYVRASGTRSKDVFWSSSLFGLHNSTPPVVDNYGVFSALEHSVGTDISYYTFVVPDDYASGDITFSVFWTRGAGSLGADESSETVKWQIKNLVVNGTSENINTGENTDATQDVYTSNAINDQIVYQTDALTIAAAEFSAGEVIGLEIMAVTVDSGTALTDPALIGILMTCTVTKVVQ